MSGFKSGGGGPLTDIEVDSGTLSVDESNDRVGIGLTDPKTKLTVEGTVTVKEQANADSDTAAYGQLWVKSNAPCDLFFTDDTGQDVRLTNNGSLAAPPSAGAVAADDIAVGDASITISGGSGDAITINATGAQAQLKTTTSGQVDITSAADIDINATTGIAIDAADEIVVTTTSADGHISLVSAHTAGVAVHIDANANAGSIVDIDAGILDIDVTGAATLDADSLTVTSDTTTFTSANADDPLVQLKNTTNDASGARLQFVKDKGAAGADGDDIGVIEFVGDDAAQTQTTFAKIVAEVSEADDSDEAGKLSFFVAESDGTTTALAAGLVLEGEHATNGEVDVTIGAGAASTTTIVGTSQFNAAATFGVDDTGVDVRLFSATASEGVLYDASEDELALLLTTKLKFHDVGGGEEIFASADGHLEINAGTTLDITAPTVDINASTALNIDGSLTVVATDAQTTNGIIGQFQAGDGSGAEVNRISINCSTSNQDTGISFMDNGATKWTLGNDGSTDDFHIRVGYGLYGVTDELVLTAAGKMTLLDDTASSATQGGAIRLVSNDGAVMGDNHRLGVIEFAGAEDTSNTISIGARIQAICRDAWDGSNNDADLEFYTTDGTTESLVLTLDADKLATFKGNVTIDSDTAATNLQITNSATDGDAAIQFALGGTVKYTMGVNDGASDAFEINVGTGVLGANTTAMSIATDGSVTFAGPIKTDAFSDQILFLNTNNLFSYNLWKSSASGGSTVQNTAGNVILDPGDDKQVEIFTDQASAADKGASLRFTTNDGALMADGHRLGVIEFAGAEDGSDTISVGARIEALCRDAWDGSNNDASLLFYTTDGTTQSEVLRLDADKLATFSGTALFGGNATFGADDTGVDVRIFSATASEGVLYDASEDELALLLTTKLKFHDVGGGEEIFASANGHLEVNAGTTLDMTAPTVDINASTAVTIDGPAVTVADSAAGKPVLTLKTTHTTKTSSGELQFLKDAADTEDGEVLGQITFYGEDEGNNNTQFAGIVASISESAETDEAGTLELQVAESDGTNTAITTGLKLEGEHATNGQIDVTIGAGVGSTTTIVGDTHLNHDAAQLKFGVDSDVSIAHLHNTGLQVSCNSANAPHLVLKGTSNDANGPILTFTKDKGAAGADSDDIGTIQFIGDDAAQAQTTFAKIVAEVSEADDSDEAGKLSLFVAESDGTTTALTAGLVLEGEHATDGQVDVTIGAGAASTTAIVGTSMFGGNATFGADDTGVDVRIFSATASEGVLYDASEDELGLLLTTKLKFHDIGGGEEIFASANGHLEINAGTTLDITAPTVDINGSTAITLDGPVTFGGTRSIGAAAGAAGGVTTIVNRVAGATDNTATAIFTVTVPNAAHTAGIFLQILGSTSDNESAMAAQSVLSVSRNSGGAAVAAVINFAGSSILGSVASVIGSGEATNSIAVTTSGMSGATDATQTFNIMVAVDTASGTTADIVVKAELLNNEASGITIAAA